MTERINAKWSLFPPARGAFPYLLLIYWIMPLYYLITASGSQRRMFLGLCLVAVFLVVYRETFWRQRLMVLWVAIEVLIVAILTAGWNVEYLFCAFFPATATGILPGGRRSLFVQIGSLAVLSAGAWIRIRMDHASVGMGDITALLGLFVTLAGAPIAVRGTRRWREMTVQLQAANQEVARLTQQEERRRIARDLHDTLGHTLTMISLKSQLAAKLLPRDADKALQEIGEIGRASSQALTQLRNVVSDMHVVNLLDEVNSARRLTLAANIALEVRGDVAAVQQRHTSLACTVLAMGIRECVNNAVKHSRASRMKLEVRETGTATELLIVDNGVGVKGAPAEIGANRSDGEGGGHHGLFNLRQRLALVGGTLEVVGGFGQAKPMAGAAAAGGTTCRMTVPRIVSGNEKSAERDGMLN